MASKKDIDLLKANAKHSPEVIMEFKGRNFPDGYHAEILEVRDDGTFVCKLDSVWSCM